MSDVHGATRVGVDAVIGLGEVGSVIYDLLKDHTAYQIIGDDIDSSKAKPFGAGLPVRMIDVLHICCPYANDFVSNVGKWFIKYPSKEIVVHSTVRPGTTELLEGLFSMTGIGAVKIVYSPVRGIQSRMSSDLRLYTKYYGGTGYAPDAEQPWFFLSEMRQCGIKTRSMNTRALELAKIYVDTTYYGWLILYAQHTKEVADKFGVDWDEMWEFSDEIQKFLGNRPKMFPGEGIGGHCILPNLELIDDEFLDIVFSHDSRFRRHIQKK